MDVGNATASAVSTIANNAQPPVPVSERQPEKQPEKQQDSTVVKLSEQAQQRDRAESQNGSAERTETKPQEAAEPPGIQFMEGENKGGRVDTFV